MRDVLCEQKSLVITAEHTILNEGRESRKNHRYAAVVQVLATQWNPCQTKNFRRRRRICESLQKPPKKPKVIHTYAVIVPPFVYIYSPVARTFSAHSACTITFTHLHACHIHARLKGAKKVLCTCVTSPHLAFSLLMLLPPSLLFPARSLRHLVPVCTFVAELFPIRKRGSSALPHERRGVWLPGRSHALHRF